MKRHKGHFRNLIMIARADGTTTEEETKFLHRMAKNIGLNEAQVNEIQADPEKYPVSPPVAKAERLERLIALVEMVMADGEVDSLELDSVHRYAIGLGFQEEEAAKVVNFAWNALQNGSSREDILEELIG